MHNKSSKDNKDNSKNEDDNCNEDKGLKIAVLILIAIICGTLFLEYYAMKGQDNEGYTLTLEEITRLCR